MTQYDVDLVQSIEADTGAKMVELEGVEERDVLLLLNKVAKARQAALTAMHDWGLEERNDTAKKRNRAHQRRIAGLAAGGDDAKTSSKKSKR